jgi:phosphate transport system substrate-binding protein
MTGKYPFWSYEHIYTNGPPSKDVEKFISFLQDDTAVFKKTGYIQIKDMKVSETNR